MDPTRRTPEEAADELAAEAPDQEWLRAVIDRLDAKLEAGELERFLSAWDLSFAGAAEAFGVSRQAVSKWQHVGVPADRMPALLDLVSATEELERRVRRERIPAVVRRSADALGGQSLLELAQAGKHAEVREAVKRMYDLRHQP